ncbi:tetratricopeptide repeat protein [Nostoc sp. ChiSLP03a]|uniref:tetratricopeptide repeat protein n=1 Tax=Nostoc sp. ChiSLP03a TaxID=3075380 RepID=UPI002AD20D53|nr:tetratricopeptide repeat protein [Nostoc sp. ChiSLP03a]MDZ8212778.1 tetratricopeptide repeat protein [Nostoc sp. ChiSLP03a]
MEFIGRNDLLTQLHQTLKFNEQSTITAIVGMGGVGKTELTLQYALKYQQSYPGGICWLQARMGDVGTQIVQFGRSRLNLNPPKELDPIAQVGFCWTNWLTGDALIIFDDVTDYKAIKPYLPPVNPRFHILLTSRLRLGRSIEQVELDVLSDSSALKLLKSLIGANRLQQEWQDAEKLCAWLGYLPLGIELVGRYLDRKPELSLAEMQQRLRIKRLEERSLKIPDDDMTAHTGVAAAFELSWETLHDEAKRLGYLLSLFALAPIPWEMVKQCLSETDAEDLEYLRDDWLLNLYLLRRQNRGVYQLHELIREFFLQKYSAVQATDDLKRRFCKVMASIAQTIPESPTRSQILHIRSLVPHIAEAALTLKSHLDNDQFMLPFIGLGQYYEGQGWYQQAQEWYEQFLAESEARFKSEDLTIAHALSCLAANYREQGRYDEAESMVKRALSIRQALLESDHPRTADSLDDLAVLYVYKQNYEQAETFCVQALCIRQQQFGSEHPIVAESFNNLASVYNGQSRYAEAEPLFLQALNIRKRSLDSDHPYITVSLNNLADCYQLQGNYQAAESLFMEALERAKTLLGEDHLSVATGLNNLAALYFEQERYTDAEPLWFQALKLHRRFLGEVHPDVALNLSNLASCYDLLGRSQEAESMYLQALEMRQTLFGNNHSKVAYTLNNLAKLYFLQERYSEAEQLYKRAIAILEMQLGHDHPITIKVRSNLHDLQTVKENLK